MSMMENSPIGRAETRHPPKRIRAVGIVFAVIGALAILLPTVATLAAEILLAWMLTFWGAVGLWFAWEMRPAREWRYAAGAFGVTLALGLAFLLFPVVGVETLTIILMLVLLAEGVVSILLGLRLSGSQRKWGWMVFSGVCSLIVGVIVLFGWPQTATWTLGLLFGVNLLSTGLSLLMLGNVSKAAVRYE